MSETAYAAVSAETLLLKAPDRALAYRVIGSGAPLILCNRFRGTLDTWDPLFLEALGRSFRVYYFDYSSFGRSTGEAPRVLSDMVKDIEVFADGLGLESFVLAGWSIGGLAAQAALATFPHRITHLIILGSNPPGKLAHPVEPVFLERALKPVNDLADEEVLFFEPASPESRRTAKESHDRVALRKQDMDQPLSPDQFLPFLKAISADRQREDHPYRDALALDKPILAICGDHDVSFPVENWYDLSRKTHVTLVILPRSGHGMQHQYPEWSAKLIEDFVQLNFAS